MVSTGSDLGGDADAVFAPVACGVNDQLVKDVLAHGRPRCEGALQLCILGEHLRQHREGVMHMHIAAMIRQLLLVILA